MKKILVAALALVYGLVAVSAPSRAADCTAELREPKVWTLEYRLSGGIAGLDRHLSLTQAAQLSVGNYEARDGLGSHVASRASPELMAKAGAFFKVAHRASPSRNDIADAIYRSLTVTSAGAKCELDVPDDMARLLAETMDAALRQAFVGAWWESAWNHCKPVPQVAPEYYDPPIQRLVFRDDGHFFATWRSGGDHSTTDPTRVPVPEYSGRYEIAPAYSYIQMSLEGGRFMPRDFSGNGHYRINGDELVLQDIWLGTYRAKNKPDICELTFQRVASTKHANETAHK